ncbi:MAG: tRNA (adenosine(37)-N6)-threonylcarbamoyltransferase complex dimerization subunit type 1 TsaB [Betaproteobacteria bacterium]|nr:tRNA (adenosine(37)-N6)-threonylcarbamoyltransferase complex dimerization subunit type 1 TsaB [Betaproteobacteria bacterium]
MNLIAIETSTSYCSLAVCAGDRVFSRHVLAEQRHAEILLDELDGLLREAGLRLADVEGIAYGEGPGAFTGLRIACGVTQGLALSRNLPVVGVGTLLAVAEEAGESRIIVCIDARMSEVYHAAYRKSGDAWLEVCVPGLCAPGALPLVEGDTWIGCGSGFQAYADLLATRLGQQLTATRPDISPTAEAILRLARPRFARGEGKPAAMALPIYLRDKVALKSSERQ